MMTLETSKKIIGKMIARQRLSKKMTQIEFAVLLDVDRQYIWRLENGKINLTMDYLDKIIQQLGCVHADFLVLKDGSKYAREDFPFPEK